MNVRSVNDILYKDEFGDYVLTYQSLKEINADFKRLIHFKKEECKRQLMRSMSEKLSLQDGSYYELLINRMSDIIFKDIVSCYDLVHK